MNGGGKAASAQRQAFRHPVLVDRARVLILDDTVLNGSFVRFPGDRLDAILAWLADRGIATVEHPELGRVLQDPGAGSG